MVPGKVLQGPDVSGWQPAVDWPKVAAAGEGWFGFAKATESTYYRDDTYQDNRAAMEAAGYLLRGAYCFAQASSTPEAEAEFFTSDIGSLRHGEAGILDAEVSGLSASFCVDWAHRLAGLCPGIRGLYCSLSYYSDVLGSPDHLIGPGQEFDFLWIAAYYTPHFTPDGDIANGPDNVPWSFWQYTDKRVLPGIPGTCDDSFYRYTLDDLRKLVGSPEPIPTPQEAYSMDRHLRLVDGNGNVLEDWLWLGSSKIMSRIPVGGVYKVLSAGTNCPSVDVDAETLTCFRNWASNAGFTG